MASVEALPTYRSNQLPSDDTNARRTYSRFPFLPGFHENVRISTGADKWAATLGTSFVTVSVATSIRRCQSQVRRSIFFSGAADVLPSRPFSTDTPIDSTGWSSA